MPSSRPSVMLAIAAQSGQSVTLGGVPYSTAFVKVIPSGNGE